MSQPELTPDYPKIDPQIDPFDKALGELNRRLVSRVIRNPQAIAEVTDFIVTVMNSLPPEQCEQGFYWNGLECVRR